MKIALISSSYPPATSGVSVVVQQLAQHLASLNHQVIVLTSNQVSSFRSDYSSNLTVYRFPAIPNPFRFDHFFPLPSVLKTKSILGQFCPDIIHLHDLSPLSFSSLTFAKKHHLPIIATHHFTQELVFHSFRPTRHRHPPSQSKALFTKTLALIYNQLQTLIVPSSIIAQRLQPHLKIPITIIPNGIDTNLFKSLNLPKTTDLIYVGRLDPEKNLSFLIKTLKTIPLRFTFTFVGSGTQEKLLKKLTINDSRFHFLPKQNYSKLPAIYNSAKIFITASNSENHPLSILEALACGLPIIAPSAGGIPDIISNKVNGLLFKPNDTQSLIDSITLLTSNSQLYKQLSHQAKNSSLKFNLNNFINQHLKIYRQLNRSK